MLYLHVGVGYALVVGADDGLTSEHGCDADVDVPGRGEARVVGVAGVVLVAGVFRAFQGVVFARRRVGIGVSVVDVGVDAVLQAPPCGRLDREAEAQLVDGFEYEADVEVPARAADALAVVEVEAAVAGSHASGGSGDVGVAETFVVDHTAVVAQVCDADVDTPADYVADVAAETEVVFVDISSLMGCVVGIALRPLLVEAGVAVALCVDGVDHVAVVGEDAEPVVVEACGWRRVEVWIVVVAEVHVLVVDSVGGSI